MEEKVVRKKRNYKSRRFWKIYGIVAAVLIIGVVIINIKAWDAMLAYEQAQPDQVLDEVLSDIQAGNVQIDIASNPYEDTAAEAKEEFLSSISGKELTYMLDSQSYDTEAPVYDVLVDDTTVCKVTLQAENKRSLMTILTIYDWSVTSIEPVITSGNYSVKVTAPDNFTVYVNGVALGEDAATGEATTLDDFSEASKYVTVPQYVTYEVTGLFLQPTVTATDQTGAAVEIPADADLTDLSLDYAVGTISDELSAMVLKNAETYSNYFSRDVANCYDSTEGIAYMFPADSYYLTMADQYRREDMWMYSNHNTPWFTDEAVSNYIAYSDTLFSVEVSFSKHFELLNTSYQDMGETRTDVNDQVYQYAYVDGNWVIVDIREVLQ